LPITPVPHQRTVPTQRSRHLGLPLLLPCPAEASPSLRRQRRVDGRTTAAQRRRWQHVDVIGDVMQVTRAGALVNEHGVVQVTYGTVRRPHGAHQFAAWRPRPRAGPCRPPGLAVLRTRHTSAVSDLYIVNQQRRHVTSHS